MKKFKIDASVLATIRKDYTSYYFKLLGSGNILGVIVDLIKSGVSPVAGVKRRFARYSKSYSDYLKGKVYFFTRSDGQVVGVPGKFPKPFPDKNPTKVNLNATGKMLKSIFLKKNPNSVYIGFKDEKAEFHNDMGAGKSKVIRRLLPNQEGETFVRNINERLKAIGKEAVKQGMNKNRRLLKVNFVLRKKL